MSEQRRSSRNTKELMTYSRTCMLLGIQLSYVECLCEIMCFVCLGLPLLSGSTHWWRNNGKLHGLFTPSAAFPSWTRSRREVHHQVGINGISQSIIQSKLRLLKETSSATDARGVYNRNRKNMYGN